MEELELFLFEEDAMICRKSCRIRKQATRTTGDGKISQEKPNLKNSVAFLYKINIQKLKLKILFTVV